MKPSERIAQLTFVAARKYGREIEGGITQLGEAEMRLARADAVILYLDEQHEAHGQKAKIQALFGAISHGRDEWVINPLLEELGLETRCKKGDNVVELAERAKNELRAKGML